MNLIKSIAGMVALLAAAVSSVCAADQAIILNENSYWRAAYLFGNERVSPERMKEGPSKWVDAKVLDKTKKDIQQYAGHVKFKHRFRNFSLDKWHEYVYMQTTSKSQSSHNHGLTWEKLPLPEKWAQPDFDDLDWPRLRNPHLLGAPPERYCSGMAQLDIGRAAFRGYFVLTEAAGTDFSLTLTYRGGVRVILNGQEIARQHLPKGALDLKTTAEEYPPEAYVVLDGEEEANGADKKQDAFLFWADLYGAFQQVKPSANVLIRPQTKMVWDRVQGLRDRKIESLKLPAKLLKKGSNCLAIEVFRSNLHPVVLNRRTPWGVSSQSPNSNVAWSHCCLPGLELIESITNNGLNKASFGALTSLRKPIGVRVWAEDIHAELYPFDFLENGAPVGKLHALGPKNGSAAAMLIVGTDKELNQVKVEVGELKHAQGGASLVASNIQLFSLDRLFVKNNTGLTRSFNEMRGCVLQKRYPKELPIFMKYDFQRGYDVYLQNKLSYLDRLQPGILAQVKPDTIQPYWLGLQIPKDARAGTYAGMVTVSGQGLSQTVLPLAVEVMDWTLPDPSAFQTVVGIEQNPYAVAKQYKAKLWSEEHVRLLEASMKQLGRVGNDWLNIPCVRKTQYGNREDQMIQWTRKKDGSLTFDFTVLDRYLDLALKYWGTPQVVNFVVVPGNQWDISVDVFDEASGKNIIVPLCDTKTGLLEERKADWAAFAKAVQGHMKARNLLSATYWGYRWDYGGYENLVTFLAEVTPEIYWTRAPHHFGILEKRDKISTCQYGWDCDVDLLQYGWKCEKFYLFNGSCRVNPIDENNPPHVYRTFVDTGLNSGLRGIAQVGGDHWDAFGDGFTMGVPRYAGFAPESLLYPGDHGAVSSVRYEALLQGLQEAEARICIEQALESGKLPDVLKAELKQALVSYANEKAFSFGYHPYLKENYGWMARARIIYNAAARAAKGL